MDKKIKVITLVSIVVLAALGAALLVTTELNPAKADTATVSQDVQPTLPSVNATFGNGFNGGHGGFGPRMICGGSGTFGGSGNIQLSSAFTENVTSILNSGTDVQALFSQGWNVTSIKPVITSTIDGNGNVITKATSAEVILQGTNGRALVTVDLTTDKVTKIVTTTVNDNPS